MTSENNTPLHEHEFKETETIEIYYPDHAPRVETKTFTKTKHKLIKIDDVPCWICGSKDKREIHHVNIEYSYADAVDWDKVKKLHPNFNWETFKDAEDFIDNEYNMMVLCEKHHRAKSHGIHHIPYPFWVFQRYMKEDFVFSRDEVIVDN